MLGGFGGLGEGLDEERRGEDKSGGSQWGGLVLFFLLSSSVLRFSRLRCMGRYVLAFFSESHYLCMLGGPLDVDSFSCRAFKGEERKKACFAGPLYCSVREEEKEDMFLKRTRGLELAS